MDRKQFARAQRDFAIGSERAAASMREALMFIGRNGGLAMREEDAIAIELAAEKRRAEEAEQRELDARRAELPRALREDAVERWRWWKQLAKRVLRSVTR
jgi:hypothetical protein